MTLRRALTVLVIAVANGWLATVIGAQSPGYPQPQVLHEFAPGPVPAIPRSITTLPDGGALIVSGQLPGVPAMIVRLEADGTSHVVHLFAPNNYPDLFGRLWPGAGGELYGLLTTDGAGSIFAVDGRGHFRIAYRFTGERDGRVPQSLVPAPNNSLVGSALVDDGLYHTFIIGASGTVTTNRSLTRWRIGAVGPDGSLYSSAWFEQTIERQNSDGTRTTVATAVPGSVFAGVIARADGALFALRHFLDAQACELVNLATAPATVMASFSGRCSANAHSLRLAPNDTVLGMTELYVFRVSPAGQVTFAARPSPTLGDVRIGDFDQQPDGSLWAVADQGGTFNGGVAFNLSAPGTPALTSFAAANAEGSYPDGSMVVDNDGYV